MVIKSFGDAPLHWNYFLVLEEDLTNVGRYIEFCEDNYKTYSAELAHLLLAASSEFDVVFHEIHNRISSTSKRTTFKDYMQLIHDKSELSNLMYEHCRIDRNQLDLQPLENIKDEALEATMKGKIRTSWNTPDWWEAYNSVKHNRAECYHEANLFNVLNAMASLSLACLYYYKIFWAKADIKEVTQELPKAKLIRFDPKYYFSVVVA